VARQLRKSQKPMNRHKWIIGAIVLLLVGIIGLSTYAVRKQKRAEQVKLAKTSTAENQVVEEYLGMYEKWSGLSAEEKGDNPWGQGQYGGLEIQRKVRAGQSERLLADAEDLANNTAYFPTELAEVLYGYNWRQKLDEHQKQQSVTESILIGSIFFLAGGGILSVGCTMRWMFAKWHCRSDRQMPSETAVREGSQTQKEQGGSGPVESEDIRLPLPDALVEANGPGHGYFGSRVKDRSARPVGAVESASEFSEFLQKLPAKAVSSEPSRSDNYFGWAVELEEKPELKTMMTTEPLTRELTELTEEVSAIRHFAAQQQDQVRKLQDGYDWMIVRRFCLRIIRCIDNIDDRIGKLSNDEVLLKDPLEDIRDELVFALEGSGVEQYEPDVEVAFKGLERYAEAVKDRVATPDAERAGYIAEVVRRGYQYLVNDDDVKIVRCAQVKLYEVTQNK
jgi:molecular chaperone GrpE (heat shock protein)